jgi:G3E family GTPase
VEQLAFADRVLLNKCDLVTDEKDLAEVERRIKMINGGVQIRRTSNSVVDMDFILNIKAFDLDKVMQMDDGFLDDNADHQHDDRVSSVGIDIEGEVEDAKLQPWLSKLMGEKGTDLFRSKGVLAVKGKKKFVFQAVHMMMGGTEMGEWADGEKRVCKMVSIGKNLNVQEARERRNLENQEDKENRAAHQSAMTLYKATKTTLKRGYKEAQMRNSRAERRLERMR